MPLFDLDSRLSTLDHLQQRRLIFIPPRHLVAVTTPRLIALTSSDHDGRGVVTGRLTVEQSLVATGRVAAHHGYSLEFVHHLSHCHEIAHRAEGFAPKVRVSTCQDHPDAAGRELRGHGNDLPVQKLGLVYRDYLSLGAHQAENFSGGIHGTGLELGAVVARDAVEAGVTAVQVRLEDLHLTPGDGGAPDAANELLTLAAEHDAADHLNPARMHP